MKDCVMCEVEASLQHQFSELYRVSERMAFEHDPDFDRVYRRCYWINNDILMLQGKECWRKEDRADA